tara:strand:- start:3882 stop:4706 length:825 start_codon:yes stop_codon:yes gene_type:complete
MDVLIIIIFLIIGVVYIIIQGINGYKEGLEERLEENLKEQKEQEKQKYLDAILDVDKNRTSKEYVEEEEYKGNEEDNKVLFLEGLEASQGRNNMEEMYCTAVRYYKGIGTNKNYVEALYWVTLAEKLGSVQAPELRKEIEEVASDIHRKSASEKLRAIKTNNNEIVQNFSGGNVYIFTCSRWGASVKIGKTNNLNRRLEEAQEEVKGTYSPRPPKVEIFFSQFSDKYSELETLVHSKLDAYRVEHSGKGREFFDIAPEEARKVIIETNKGIEKI